MEARADVVAAAALATADLEARVNLSQPYFRVLQALVVNADVRPDLRSRDDLAGDVDAVLVHEADAVAAVGVRPVLRIIETIPPGAGLALAVDPRNGSLLEAINEALAAMAAEGAYDRIYERYQSSLPPGGRITAA